ncbi:MAG: putative endonuclease [Modestobacter sp.]|nr:putative endonuclease [Modestobacter sp.]
MVQQLDAAAVAERMAQTIRDRRVSVYPGEDGMATLSAVLPAPVARAVRSALEQYADAAVTEGDQRTRAQRMAHCLVDLVLRPGEHGLAPVQAKLTVVAAVRTLLGGDEPGEVDGDLVPPAMVRQLAATLGLMPDVQGTGDTASDPEKGLARAGQARELRNSAEVAARAGLAELLGVRRLAGTALDHRPHVALVDELRGRLVALTDASGLRRGEGLGPPAESPGYPPREALDRFVRSRDRRCRFPGCRARPPSADLDHTVPWSAGPTSAANLTCLCRYHHRLSHQAPGWRLRGLPDGGLEWTTPTGQVRTTRPPGYGTDEVRSSGRPAGRARSHPRPDRHGGDR